MAQPESLYLLYLVFIIFVVLAVGGILLAPLKKGLAKWLIIGAAVLFIVEIVVPILLTAS